MDTIHSYKGFVGSLQRLGAVGLCALVVACGGGSSTSGHPKTVAFTSPDPAGRAYTASDDLDSTESGIQVDVAATVTGVSDGDPFVLYIDSPTDCDGTVLSNSNVASGTLTFAGVTLPDGSHSLQICSADGQVKSDKVAITVDGAAPTGCPTVTFVTPASTGSSLTLAESDDTDGVACGTSFTISVEVSTDAPDGAEVDLFVNGSVRGTATANAGSARFDGVALDNRGTTPNALEIHTTAGDGHACSMAFGNDVFVDCPGASCAITKPDPAGPYLNASLDTSTNAGFQTDVEVSTDAASAGKDVQLVIDGDETGAASAPVVAQGTDGIAAFGNVQLDEGAHQMQAVCTDSTGAVTRSGVVTWTVDITPCDIVFSEIAGGADPVTDSNDTDSTTDGIQVATTGSVSGAGCTGVRVGACSGLPADYTAVSGATWSETITLGSAASQDVCAEVQDDAGNVSQVQQTVNVLTTAPQLVIMSPVDGTAFNASGDATHTQDLDPNTTSCDATFVVNCSAGVKVELLNQATSAVLASAACAGMSGLPAPYTGQANFASVSLPSSNLGTTLNVVARQAAGSLVGLSTPVGLQSDCDKPSLTVINPGCGGTLRMAVDDSDSTTAGFQHDVVVQNANTPKPTVTLQILDSAQNPVNTLTSSTPTTGTTTRFTNADFGSGGQLTLSACATDAAGNTGCAPACRVDVTDLPSIAITQPANRAALSSADDCSGASGLQIEVSATTDAADGSAATVQIGSQSAVAATVNGGAVSVCTDAPEGLSIPVVVSVTDARGSAKATINVDIDTQPPSNAIDDLSVAFNGTGRRAGRATFSWTAVADVGGGPLARYALRCAPNPIATEADWSAATVIPVFALPATPGTPQSLTVGGFRITESQNCALRGADTSGALTPLASPGSVVVAPDFLQQPVNDANGIQMGDAVAGVGDVNGDGIADVLVGGVDGPAYLYFGSSAGLSAAPSVEIDGPGAGDFGRVVSALGDVSGDGVADFAVSARLSGNQAGTVYVFFGRKTNSWPAVIDVSSACNADLCLTGAGNTDLGWRVTSADFDGAAARDLVLGTRANRVYVLLGGAQLVLDPPNNTLTIPGNDPTKLPNGFVVSAATTGTGFGSGVATVGDFLNADGADDLVIAVSGNTGTGAPGAVVLLAGRPYDTSNTGVVPIPSNNLFTLDTGTAGQFGADVRAIGDYDGDGRQDVAVPINSSAGAANVYLQTRTGFTTSSVVTLTNTVANSGGDAFAASLGEGLNVAIGSVGDLDKDGRADLFTGSTQRGTGAGTCELFFGATPAASRTRSTADESFSLATGRSVAADVGDVNGDGYPDLAIGDPGYGSGQGRIVVLY